MSGEDTSGFVDRSRAVRPGEELPIERLEPWLRAHVPGAASAGAITVEQFPSGHSNLTYRVRAGAEEWVLRRPPFGSKVKSAHDMGREFRILSRLHAVYPPAPRPLAYCEDPEVLGAPFYVMERIRGVILRKDPPPGLVVDAATARGLCEALIDNLARIHGLDVVAAGLADLGKPQGYVERQVTGWTRRYHDSQTDDVPEILEIARWLAERIPPERGAVLIHNDYKFDNVVLDPADLTRIVGVLDWEMSTIGDPLMDLGTALAYWIQPSDPQELQLLRWGPTHLDGALTRGELVDRYAAATGHDTSGMAFYYAFALFKTAVVLQQIYYRWKQGLTKDERFAWLIHGVRVLGRAAVRVAETGMIG